MRASLMAMALLALADASFSARAQSYDHTCSGYGGLVIDSEREAYCTGYRQGAGACTGSEDYQACMQGARASSDESGSMQQNQAQMDELEKSRREVERLPILAPEGNPLLGRWQRAATTAPAPNNLYDSLMQLGNDVACTFISGDGPNFEFHTDALVHGAQTVDAMRYYRGQDGVVLALGAAPSNG
jgi:hypothetical protein